MIERKVNDAQNRTSENGKPSNGKSVDYIDERRCRDAERSPGKRQKPREVVFDLGRSKGFRNGPEVTQETKMSVSHRGKSETLKKCPQFSPQNIFNIPRNPPGSRCSPPAEFGDSFMTAINVQTGYVPSRKIAMTEARKRLAPLFAQMANMIADEIRGKFDWEELSDSERQIYLLLHGQRYIH